MYRKTLRNIPRGLPTGQLPLPQVLKTRMAYHARLSRTPAAVDALGVYVIDASSLYDPDYTGVGHQPMGYDQIAPMYDHWFVNGAKISVTFANAITPSSQTPMIVGISGQNVVTPLTDPSHYIELPNCKHGVIGYEGVKTLTNTYSPKLNMGVSNPADAERLHGTQAANPSDNWFWHIFVSNANPGVQGVQVAIDVTVEYTATFIEPKQLAQS